MGWLRCDPDEMFKKHVYTGPAVYGRLPPAAQQALAHAGAALPPSVTSYLQRARVIAAPMQVVMPHVMRDFHMSKASFASGDSAS